MGFELKALHLLSRHSTTWATNPQPPSSLYLFIYLFILRQDVPLLPKLASNSWA
jgi:hypothetical protein